MTPTRKRLDVERNGLEFGLCGGRTYMGYICPYSFQCHLGSFGALISKFRGTRKRLTVEENGLQFGTHVYVLGCIYRAHI